MFTYWVIDIVMKLQGNNERNPIRKEYPELLEPVEEHTKDKMDEALKQHIDGHKDTKFVSESMEGQWFI